jgi:excinuclease ABC subunit C
VLDDIPNIGERRKLDLIRNFPDLESIRSADVETLAKVPSMNEKAARSVYDFFHHRDKT